MTNNLSKSSFKEKSVWVVLPAAGVGSRMGANIPKQYLKINQYPIICHILSELLSYPIIAGVMVVVAKDDFFWPKIEKNCIKNKDKLHSCIGGLHRADSVLEGLRALPQSIDNDDWVLVHDAARPGLTHKDLSSIFQALSQAENITGLIPCLESVDTLKQLNADGLIEKTLDRCKVFRAQTPQCFKKNQLKKALEGSPENFVITDESSAMEAAGFLTQTIQGNEDNFKVTTANDLLKMKWIIDQQRERNERKQPRLFFSQTKDFLEKKL